MRQIIKRLVSQRCGLRDQLVSAGQTRWLDVGGKYPPEKGFISLNLGSKPEGEPEDAPYIQADFLQMRDEDLKSLGTFDLVRLQHVFEHFSFQEGQIVLQRCAILLRPGGFLLLSVPNLRFHIAGYLIGPMWYRLIYPSYPNFTRWFLPSDAPSSMTFSIFTHQGGEHKFCYDRKSLLYSVRSVGYYENVQILSILSPLAGVPFTHNRPAEDLCLLAQKANTQ
jgi:SAM-dependent methyltransferase